MSEPNSEPNGRPDGRPDRSTARPAGRISRARTWIAAAGAAAALVLVGSTVLAPTASAAASHPGLAAAPAVSVAGPIQNDVFWKDTSGNPIYSQGGGC